MLFAIVCIIVIVCLLLVLVILAQKSKGGGLSSQFGGSGTSQLIGVKKTGDLLEKLTWGLAIGLMVLTLSTNFIIESSPSGPSSPNIERARQMPLPNIPSGLESTEGAGEETPALEQIPTETEATEE
jgi:preprotein translocase subunit SecG